MKIENVQAFLIGLNQHAAAALLFDAEFKYDYLDTIFRLDATHLEKHVYELRIIVPPKVYSDLSKGKKILAEQVEAAIEELTQHADCLYVKSTSWGLKLPTLDDVASLPNTEELSDNFDLYDIQRLWTKATGRSSSDPDGAVTSARTMLEALLKRLINDAGGSFTNRDDLPNLYKKAVETLQFSPGRQTEDDYRKLAGSCATIINAITRIRNCEGDAHSASQTADFLQAKFVVNVAGSLAEFLLGLQKTVGSAPDRRGPQVVPDQLDS